MDSPTTVLMLVTPWCGLCPTAKKMLGDAVEVVDVTQRPELLEHTTFTSTPIYLVFKGDECVGSFAGLMPRAAFDKKMAAYL